MARRGRSRRFVLTAAAEADLAEISDFIRQDSPEAARRVRSELRTAMRRLAAMPGMGHIREDLAGESLRFWSVYAYLIIYRPDTDPLLVRVLQGARDVRAILDQE
jgi:plasmid stabilization system protein ParE